MILLRGLPLPNLMKKTVVTLGNFDGIHLGHQHLLKKVTNTAHQFNLTSVAVTFEPLPHEYFQNEKAPARLSTLREKFLKIQSLGLDYLIALRFNKNLAALSAEDFIKEVLIEKLNAKRVIVGDDFRFGYQRKGDFVLLKTWGEKYGFEVDSTETLHLDNERVGSSRVRKAIADSDFTLAEKLLGYHYYLSGRVIYGDQRGRVLGFPTANLALKQKVLPLRGVFIVNVKNIGLGVANIGRRPTFDSSHPLLEVYLLDFQGNLYGKRLEIEFIQKLRDEKKFDSIEALKKQIEEDVNQAKKYDDHRL